MSQVELETVRAANSRIGESYDQVLYEAGPEPLLEVERVLGLAALYGYAPPQSLDVFDIGCALGGLLQRTAAAVDGRLVGTDISPRACAEAERRLEGLGERARIISADILDVDAEVGQFDLIYCIGVAYVVPAPVREHIFRLIVQTLRPGGVAVITYYVGAMGLLRQELNRIIRRATDSTLSTGDRLTAARRYLAEIGGLPSAGGLAIDETVRQLFNLSDTNLFHETFCDDMVCLRTGEVEETFRTGGLEFLAYIQSGILGRNGTSAQRARHADVNDFLGGGYRFALYGRPSEPAVPPPRISQAPVRWRSELVRSSGQLGDGAPARFEHAVRGNADVPSPVLQATLDVLAEGPIGWSDLIVEARRKLAAVGSGWPDHAEVQLEGDFEQLCEAGFITPLWRGQRWRDDL